MAISLQDQLKNSGLVDDKKAKQLKRAKQKQEKQTRKSQGKGSVVDEKKLELERKKAERAEKDRQLNQEKNEREHRHAIAAQIRQLIETHSIKSGADTTSDDKKYSFIDAGKIKHLWVSQPQVDQLSRGQIAIVRNSGKYVLVPAAVADKIAQRDSDAIVSRAEQDQAQDENDPYSEYQIPDDLDW